MDLSHSNRGENHFYGIGTFSYKITNIAGSLSSRCRAEVTFNSAFKSELNFKLTVSGEEGLAVLTHSKSQCSDGKGCLHELGDFLNKENVEPVQWVMAPRVPWGTGDSLGSRKPYESQSSIR